MARRRGLFARAGLSCPQVVELLSDWIDGALDAATARRVQTHLTACDGCHTYLDQLRATIAAVGDLPLPEPDPEQSEALVRAFRDWHRA